MKHVYAICLAAVLLALVACEKDKETAKTTYQVINNMESDPSELEPLLDGTLWEVIVFCYDKDGDVIRQDNLDPVETDGGKSEITEVDPECVKVKLSFKFLPPESEYYSMADRLYVVAFTNIVKGKNNEVVVNGETMTGGTLKSTSGSQKTMKETIHNLLK